MDKLLVALHLMVQLIRSQEELETHRLLELVHIARLELVAPQQLVMVIK
jgi:hypothetical protein